LGQGWQELAESGDLRAYLASDHSSDDDVGGFGGESGEKQFTYFPGKNLLEEKMHNTIQLKGQKELPIPGDVNGAKLHTREEHLLRRTPLMRTNKMKRTFNKAMMISLSTKKGKV
jgi:hypothetical protein